MNTFLARPSATAIVTGLCVALAAGCAVDGGGYGYDSGPGFAGDYYEPYGGSYGGWGGGYQVGPVRGDGNRSYDGGQHHSYGGGSASHAYRSAPASRPAPSIPSGSHSGGSRRY